ncbi:MAG: T9SS C-terminal target domain-containing protein, partial [Bacteroidetes bacterium]
LATDGGLYKTSDLGATWSDPENIPTTQFYRVAYNPHRPDLYFGGAQDNGTTGGNAQMINDWPRIFGGDGFQPAFHPDNPDVFYVETQNGNISVTQNGGLSFAPADNGIPFNDARNWDMPYMISGHWPDRLLAGTDRVYVSHSGVVPEFKAVSPNLTEFDDSTTTRNHNISTLHESPLDSNLVYVGTADGRVWRSDALLSGNWEEISAGLPDRYVTSVKASPTFLDWVYVVQSGYRDNEFIPRVHRSKNRGETWEDISANLPDLAINDIYVLPEHQDSVLFVANDGGVYGTIDGGASWHRVGKNMPLVPVYDLEWNVVKNEIVAGTFARSIMSYALDSLLFPQEPVDTTTAVTQAIQKKPTLRVYPSPASQYVEVAFNNTEPGRDAHLAILDESGRVVLEKTVPGFGETTDRFDVSSWRSGVYVVKIKIRHQVLTGRFVKI